MMNATQTVANEILSSYTMDYTSQIEHAMRADGVWFTRSQYRCPRYGYKWTAWRIASAPSGYTSQTGRSARLPKGGR
jgi:hypothetical protein